MLIEITGQDAIAATEELLNLSGIEGSYETVSGVERTEVLTTIATIVGLTVGTIELAERLQKWGKKYQILGDNSPRIEKVLLVKGEKRLVLQNPTLEQLQQFLKDS